MGRYHLFTNFEIMPSKSKVYFFFDNVRVSLANRGRLKKYIESIFKSEKVKLKTINYIFCPDKSLLKINKLFLNHNYYTDIITFDMSETKTELIAEIYISIDRVRDNAKAGKYTIKEELHRVIFHGALHLCGYSDKTNSEKIEMRNKEDFYLKKYFKECSSSHIIN